MEDIRSAKAWQACTFVGFGQGGTDATDCAGLGIGAIRAGSFLPVEAAGGYKPWQARTFAAAELARSVTLKSYWVQKP